MWLERVFSFTHTDTHAHTLQPESEPSKDEVPPASATLPQDIIHRSTSGVTHRLTPLIDEKTSEYARYIFEPVDSTLWSIVHEDGEMKVYRREMEEDGVVIDPLRATYTANVCTTKHHLHKLPCCTCVQYTEYLLP